jgi:GNAT superfamily N-acetyltransferase
MITFAREAFHDAQPEYGDFVYEYWHNSPENGVLDRLDFDWEVYHKLDNDGLLHLTVGRDDGRLVAAALYLIMMDIKRKWKKVATCDTFAVSRNYRGLGIGRELYAAVEPALIALGVNEIQNGYREVYKVQPLFERLGFYIEQRMYVKKVDG